MTELPAPDRKYRVTEMVDRHTHAMMEELNELHENFLVPDGEIVAVLREGGYGHEADLYEDWIQDEDPPRRVDEADPEGPGPGVVPDPPNPSYEPLVAQLQAQREATSITYEWTERERQMFSCRATVNRSQLQTWLNANVDSIVTPEEIDAETLVEFLEADYSAVTSERRWAQEGHEVDHFDLKAIQPDGVVIDPSGERQAKAFKMLRDAKDVPTNGGAE